MATAWGSIEVKTLNSALAHDRTFVFNRAATPDGQWLVGTDRPRASDSAGMRYAALYGVRTGGVHRLRALLSLSSQIIGAAADDRWVVWAEAADEPNFFDWQMFAFDTVAGTAREIAEAAKVDGKPVAGPIPAPVLDHGRVVWGQFIGPYGPTRLSNAVVRIADLSDGTTDTLATAAGQPSFSWPWVSWGVPTPDGHGYTQLANLQTGDRTRLDVQPAAFVLGSRGATYNNGDYTELYLIDDLAAAAARPTLILRTNGSAGDYVQFPSLDARLVAWEQYSLTQVYDRREHRLVVLPVTRPGTGSWVGGHLLVWLDPVSSPDASGTTAPPLIRVVDVAALPARP